MKERLIRILGISGSSRERSANTLLLRHAAAIAPERASLRIDGGLGELPNPDLDAERPPAVICASPHPAGGEKAHASLFMTLRMLNADIAHGGTLLIPYVGVKLNAEGEITDPDAMRELGLLTDALIRAAAANDPDER